MSNSDFSSLQEAKEYISEHNILKRLTNDLSLVTDITADHILKRAVTNTVIGSSLLNKAKNTIMNSRRPIRRSRQPRRYDPYLSDIGIPWIKGSGSSTIWNDRLDPTDQFDWDTLGDGGSEKTPDYDFDPDKSSESENDILSSEHDILSSEHDNLSFVQNNS